MKNIYKLLFSIGSSCIISSATAQNMPTLDSSFSEDGWDRSYIHHNGTYLHNFLLDENNKPLLVMQGNFMSEAHQAMVVRYNTDGTLDETYNGSGIVKTGEDFSEELYTRATGSCPTGDGGMYIAADYWYVGERVIKLRADGTLDPTFGDGGYADFERDIFSYFFDIEVMMDGTVMVLGRDYFEGPGLVQFFVLALNSDGSIKTSFGHEGVAAFDLPAGFTDDNVSIWGMEAMTDNTLMLHVNLYNDVFNYKIDGDGMLVTSFSGDGIAMNTVPGELYSSYAMNHFKMDDENNFWRVYRGYDSTTFTTLDRVMKINADGTLNPISFNNGFSLNNNLQLEYFLHWSNNKIYLAGTEHSDPTKQHLFRFNEDGTPDNTFNSTGRWSFPEDVPYLRDVQMLTDTAGNMFIAGIDNENSDSIRHVVIKIKNAESPIVTSINTPIANQLQVSISPNPVKNILFVSSSEATSINLYNISGRLIHKNQPAKQHMLQMSELTPGTYIMRMGSKSYKIVKSE